MEKELLLILEFIIIKKILMKRVVNIYQKFNDNLLKNIKDENSIIYYLIKDKLNLILNLTLKEVEVIAKKAKIILL